MSEQPFTHAALRAAETVHFRAPGTARFQDVDAAGTVFYPRYFDYLSDASMAFLASRGLDVPSVVNRQEWLAPLAHVEADYAAPLRFGDRFVLELVGLHAGRSAYAFGARLVSDDADRRLLATLFVVHVCIDPKSFRAAPLPDRLRDALTPRDA